MPGKGDKTRVIVSQRLISPLSCCNNFNSKAVQFRSSVVKSISLSRLNPDIAVKAAMGGKTYEDTDNKKREFTGTTKPGVTEISPGVRVEENQSWEEGRSLVLYPSWKSKRAMNLDANFGWIKDVPDVDFETAQNKRLSKPQLQFTKYDVSKKTDDIIPESETEIDMAYPSLGLSRAQRLKRDKERDKSNSTIQFKGLPGRSLESRVPGGNLLARTAGRLGIARDANNKFRCPPGTPAANQFTDHLGTNCFGVSLERAAKFIADKIGDMMRIDSDEDGTLSLASGAKMTWREKVTALRDIWVPGRDPSYDGSTGERIPTPDARAVDVPGRMRWFKNATVNAQQNLRRSENIVDKLGERVGITGVTPDGRAVNDDRWATFTALKERGLWDVEITGRLREEQVDALILARLQRNPGFMRMGQRERDALLAADKKRYYETERAFLDTALEQFALRPEHMRTVGRITFRNDSLPNGAEADTMWVPDSRGADIKSEIRIHLPTIMNNQEQLIPNMGPNERLVISAVGAPTDAAAAAELADFLVNTEYTARGMAGLIDGPRSFARHIMLHEIGHTIQGEAFLTAVRKQLDATGSIKVPVVRKGKITSDFKEVTDFKKLTGNDLAALVISSQDDINVASLAESMSRIENVAFLAGSYPRQYKKSDSMETYALEATAELFALREQGIIFGDDVDDALSWMDDADRDRIAEARAISEIEIFEKLEESYFSPYDRGEDVLPIRKHLRAPIELDKKAIEAKKEKRELAELDKIFKEMNQEQIANTLADLIEDKDILNSQLMEARAQRRSIESSSLPDAEKAEALAKMDAAIEQGEAIMNKAEKAEQLLINANRAFNTDGKKASEAEIRKMAREILDKRPPATPEEASRRMRKMRVTSLEAEAAELSDEALVRRIADLDLAAASAKPGSDEYVQNITDREIFVRQYMTNKSAADSTKTTAQIKKELKAEITKITTEARDAVDAAKRGKIKPQKMKSKEHIAANAKKERGKHRRNITKQQFEAVKEIDDFDAAGVTQMLNPERQVAVGRAMNKKNARLNRLGLEADPASIDEGSFDEQIENILVPAMESIDASSITTPFEMEIFVDSSKTSRVKPGKEIELDTFGQGKVLSRSMKPGKPAKGEKKKRVVVRMKEGDRGIFPLAPKGEDQKFVIPPGKLRVVGRDKDGSLIVEVASQKDTTDVLDDMAKSVGDGPGDAIWRQGAKKKIQAIADRHAIKRKDDSPGTKSDDAAKITEVSESMVAEVSELGGDFGETLPESPSLASGARPTTESLRRNRHEKYKSILGESGNRPPKLQSSLSALREENEMLHRRVEEILNSESIEQITERIEDAALKLHSGFDRRVRVRMKESDIDELSKSGKIRTPSLSSGAVSVDGDTRRVKRIRRKQRDFSKTQKQKEAAEGAQEQLKTLKDGGAAISVGEDGVSVRGLDKLSDSDLKSKFGLKRSKQRSVLSDNQIYTTDSAEQAIALMALGYEVEVPDRKERKMVKNAGIQTQEELKKTAIAEADLLFKEQSDKDKYIKKFMDEHDIDLCLLYSRKKNVFCSKNIFVNRENMPQSGGATKGADSPAMRALVGGHIEGDFVDTFNLSKDDRDRLKEIRKKLKKPDENNPLSEEDRNFAALHEDTIGRFSDIAKKLGSGDPDKIASVSQEDRDFVFNNTNWAKTEAKTEPQLIEFLKRVLPDGENSVVRTSKKPDELYASQKQLKHAQIDGQAENILKEYLEAAQTWGEVGTPEFEEKRAEFLKGAWFQGAILTSRDGYVVDGHHRWAAIKMINDHLPKGHEKIEVQVNEIQESIFESLKIAKVFQEHMGIKGKTVGKDPFPYTGGTPTQPMSKEEFERHLKTASDEIQRLAKDVQDKKLYPVSVKDLEARKEPRSRNLKPDRDRSVEQYGMTWKPEYSEVESVEKSKTWDGWDGVEVTDVDLSSDILPTESHLKGSSIDKVVSGGEQLREGYFVNLVIDKDGKMYVSDGHNRVAMNRALGKTTIKARVVDLRKAEEPWGEATPGKSNYKGYDLVEPKNPTPKLEDYKDPKEMPTDEEISAASAQREKLAEVEKEITSTLIDTSEKHGGIMVGLAFRMKSIKAIAGKINRERGNRTARETAEEMSDVIRYTTTFTPENYVSGAKAIIGDLEAAGYKLTVKNYWMAGDPYQGINIAAVHPDGTRFELQFHTPQSAADKEVIHKFYEEYRDAKDAKTRWTLYDRMARMAENIGIPVEDGLLDIGEIRTQDFSLSLSSGATTRRDKINKRGLNVGGSRGAGKSEPSLSSGALDNAKTGRSVGKNKKEKEITKLEKEKKPDWFEQFRIDGEIILPQRPKDIGSESLRLLREAQEKRLYHLRKYYGLGPDVDDELMPVSGYLVHKSHIQKKKNEVLKSRSGNIGPDAVFEIGDDDVVGSGLTAFGDIEVVLKPEVSKRTAYGKGDGLKNGHRPVRMDSKSRDDISHAVSFSPKDNYDDEVSDSIVNLLASSFDGDFSRVSKNSKTKSTDAFEAHILGGFDRDEVDSINYPYSKLSKISASENISDVVNDKTVADSLRKMGFTQQEIDYFYSVGGSGQINTASMAKLREYRAAKKIKEKYAELGFNKVNIAHPQGLNIENPRSHSKASRGIEDVETLLRGEIAAEIAQTAKDMLKEMRKNSKPQVVSKAGSGI